MLDTKRVRLGAGLGIFALVGILLVAAPARAEDAKPGDAKAGDEMTAKVTELEAAAKKHATDHADDAMVTDITAAVKLCGEVSDPKLKARLIQVVGSITVATTHDGVQKAGIKGLADIGDPTGFRFIRSFCVQHTSKDNPPLMLDAIEAASKMKSNDSVPVLMTLVEKSDVMPVAVAALKAFSTFGQNKPIRETIVGDLVDTVKKDRPGVGYRWSPSGGLTGAARAPTQKTRTGEETVNRYQALAGVLCETLNKMTGQNIPAPEDWFDLRDKYKSNMSGLFTQK